MDILLRRVVASDEATIGILSIDGKPECWSLEDQFQAKKVFSETRIPSGRYKLKAREKGGMYPRYKKKWPDLHRGMIEIMDVPGFTDILFHIGNKDDDTAGCVLVGRHAVMVGRYTVLESRLAYLAFYTKVVEAVYNGACRLTVMDDEQFRLAAQNEPNVLPPHEPAQADGDGLDLMALRHTIMALKGQMINPHYPEAIAELLKRVARLEDAKA